MKSSCGFTYLAALMLIMVSGIMLGMLGQSWRTVMQREREEELLFRGDQIRNAIVRWHSPRPGQHPRTPLNDLKHLLKDPRSASTVRYLRRPYTDPVTGKEWVVLRDPVWGIVGVASSSGGETIKQGNFPDQYKDFEGKKSYSDWKFLYSQPGAPQPAGGTGQMPKVGG